ncbi:hypothetical protein UK17_23145 [Salmonella enterica subsp. enterica]|nr:hypothetical protein [Salmonella enterica subsp. enterica serovar Wandsworth]
MVMQYVFTASLHCKALSVVIFSSTSWMTVFLISLISISTRFKRAFIKKNIYILLSVSKNYSETVG